MQILMLLFTYVTLASSWNLLAGYAGQVSLGNAAFFGASGFTMLILLQMGVESVYSMLIGVAVAVLFALLMIPLFRLRGAYFAIGTLFFALALQHFYTYRQSYLYEPLILYVPLPKSFTSEVYYIAAFLLAYASVMTVYLISKSRLYYALRAIRDDEDIAEKIGINTFVCKIIVLLVVALFTGAAGAIYIHFVGRGYPPDLFSLEWSGYPLVMCVLGGVGSLIGPIIGALLFLLLSELLTGLVGALSLLLWSIILIAVIHFFPTGIYGILKRIWVRRGGL